MNKKKILKNCVKMNEYSNKEFDEIRIPYVIINEELILRINESLEIAIKKRVKRVFVQVEVNRLLGLLLVIGLLEILICKLGAVN